jgi:hypothetical protein
MTPICLNNVNKYLETVYYFLFLALKTQHRWTNRNMFKPPELTTRQIVPSINRLNDALPFFKMKPMHSDSPKLKSMGYWNFHT